MILDLCGGTGAWSKPYVEAGYKVEVIDILDGKDVRLVQKLHGVRGILAAPPCTHLARSGARWWESKGENALLEGLVTVDACLRVIWACKPVWWALENPIGRLTSYLGKPKLYFNPCDYGDPYTKKTCLWGEFNVPEKCPVEPVKGSRIYNLPDSKGRQRLRSVTPEGFAKAFFKANP